MPLQSVTRGLPHVPIRKAASFAPAGGGPTGGGGGRAGETPQQKVARLREAAQKAKAGNATIGDKLYYRGRVWADRAHRVVALGLIGATVLCGIATIATFTDIMIHNRKLRKQHAEETKRILALEAHQRQEQAAENEAFAAASRGAIGLEPNQKMASSAGEMEVENKGKGVVANLKTWALKDLTPADQEYKSRFDKDDGPEAVIGGTQDKWVSAEGRAAEQETKVSGPDPFEKGIVKKVGDEKQSKGVTASILSWFGR